MVYVPQFLFCSLFQYISGNFDTTSGAKTEAESYVRIATEIGVIPSDILFFTDITKGIFTYLLNLFISWMDNTNTTLIMTYLI